MLDKFIDVQPLAYQIVCNSIKNNRISHAYLIVANGYNDVMSFVMSFVKSIVCPKHIMCDNCSDCDLCKRIDDNNYTELKIIEPDGMWLKKEQIIDLQEDFSLIGLEGKNRIYIIKDCEKMNTSTANSILKFLEEPNPNIIAILITNNRELLLDTIVSRCQVIRMFSSFYDLSFIDRFKYCICGGKDINDIDVIIDRVINYILSSDNRSFNGIISYDKLVLSYFKKRDDLMIVFNIILYFYYDCMKYLVGDDKLFFTNKIDKIKMIGDSNSLDSLLNKIKNIDYLSGLIRYNINTNLLFDKLCFVLGGSI